MSSTDPGFSSQAEETSPSDHPFAATDGGRYQRGASLGAGGMGTVELAYDRRLLREVALKTPRALDADAARRLAQEAWITAQLDHPGIVPIYDAGRRADGTIFYTMRVIRGRSLEDELAAAPDAAARLRFVRHFLVACEATAYAHKLGIVHRDLKPQNILVGELGETQVADWGVARPTATAMGQAWRDAIIPDGHAVETVAGSMLGTPAYMSPEQSVGAPADPRADVWSLGAILFRIVTGRPAFPGATASEVLAQVRHGPTPTLPEDAPRELAAIVQRALSRDPAARYPSARELAEDVASWLDGRRVSAHSYSRLELLKRLVRAWRVPLAVAGVALAVLVVGGIVAVDGVVSARDGAEVTLGESLVAQAEREAARGQWPEAELLAAEALARADAPEARGFLAALDRPRPRLVATRPAPCPLGAVDPTGLRMACIGPTVALWDLGPTLAPAPRWEAPIEARFVAFADAETLVVADRQDRLHRLGLDGRERHPPLAGNVVHGLTAGAGWTLTYRGWVVASLAPGASAAVTSEACRPQRTVRLVLVGPRGGLAAGCDDGRLAASRDGLAWVHVESGLGVDDMGTVGALSGDERTLAIVTDKGRLTLLDWPAGRVRTRVETGLRGARMAAFAPEGERLAVASLHGATRVLDAGDGRELERLPRDLGRGVRWDGAELEARGDERLVRWALPAPAVAPVIGASPAGIAALAVSADLVAVGRGQGQIELYGRDGQRVGALSLGDQTVKALDFSPDGQRLYAVGPGSTSVVVRARGEGWPVVAELGRAAYRRVGALADGRVVAASWSLGPQLFAPGDASPDGAALGGEPVSELELAPDRRFAALLEESTDRVLVLDGPAPRPLVTEPGALALGASRDEVAVASRERLRIVDLAGRERAAFDLDGAVPLDLAFTADAALIAVAALDGAVRIHARDGRLVATLRGHEERVAGLVATPEALFSASWDGAVRRWGWAPLTASAASLLDAAHRTTGLDLARVLARGR